MFYIVDTKEIDPKTPEDFPENSELRLFSEQNRRIFLARQGNYDRTNVMYDYYDEEKAKSKCSDMNKRVGYERYIVTNRMSGGQVSGRSKTPHFKAWYGTKLEI